MLEELVASEEYSRSTSSPAKAAAHPALRSLITRDGSMQKLFRVLEKVADTTSTVLILGESGTGKELVARAVHMLSGARGHFVPVNCGAIPDNLLESELFGYEKGAFTGAVTSKPGRFSLADGGTIFLDEIGDMSPHLQVKILRVLQDRVVEPVGGTKAKTVNVRVIAATNVHLETLVREGKFREDLYYRLQVVPVHLPPLRARGEDVLLLANHFSKKAAQRINRRPLVFSEEAAESMKSYHWPGNVRELENLVERLSILLDTDAVYGSDLPDHVRHPLSQPAAVAPTNRPTLPDEGLDFNAFIESLENELISQALERTKGNKKAAAQLLRLNRTTLVEKIKKKGLEVCFPDLQDG